MVIIWSGQLEQNQWNLIKFEQASTIVTADSGLTPKSVTIDHNTH